VQAALPEDTRLVRLIAAAERRRGEAHAALAGYLAGPAFRRLGIELAWLAGGRDWQAALPEEAREALDRELSGFAAQVLQRRHKRLRGAGAEIADLDIAGLHALRLRGKRMRYAAEILAPAFPGKPARRFIDRLATLQARLGRLNDRAVAAELLGGLGGPGGRHAYAVGVVTGALARDGMTIRPRIERAWEKFLRQPAFWA
jgi:triphosphatase